MAYYRILRTVSGEVLTRTFTVNGTATDATGNVTATLYRLDGSVVNTATAGHPGGAGVYTYTVPAQANVDMLRLEWTGTLAGASVLFSDYIEIVGGFLFDLDEARALPPALLIAKWPQSLLAAKRVVVEDECERICGYAMVPRFARFTLSGTGTPNLLLPCIYPRKIRSVTVDGTAMSAGEIAALRFGYAGVLSRPNGFPWSAFNPNNVIVEVEHGLDFPAPGINNATMLRLRTKLTDTSTEVPQRALSFTLQSGGVYRLATPSGERTGVPEVDAVYERETVEMGGFA